jgi:hypothetical protein
MERRTASFATPFADALVFGGYGEKDGVQVDSQNLISGCL